MMQVKKARDKFIGQIRLLFRAIFSGSMIDQYSFGDCSLIGNQ
jgi:hypothetical protein